MESAPLEWHRVGTNQEVVARTPFSVNHGGFSIAVFSHQGRLRAIGNRCNHKGGPLCEGRLRGETVTWHLDNGHGWREAAILNIG